MSSPATPKATPVPIAIAKRRKRDATHQPDEGARTEADVRRRDSRDRTDRLGKHEEADGPAKCGAQQRENRLDDLAAGEPQHRTDHKADPDHGVRNPRQRLHGRRIGEGETVDGVRQHAFDPPPLYSDSVRSGFMTSAPGSADGSSLIGRWSTPSVPHAQALRVTFQVSMPKKPQKPKPAPKRSQGATAALDKLRVKIDSIDSKLVAMLNERSQLVVRVGKHKRDRGIPIYAPHREAQVLENVLKANRGPLSARSMEGIYRELMSGSFALEQPIRVGFLGPAGSFSHAAAVRHFGSSVEFDDLHTIAGVFAEVRRGHVDYGLVPIENSIGGGDRRDAGCVPRRARGSVGVRRGPDRGAPRPARQLPGTIDPARAFQARRFSISAATGWLPSFPRRS
jgi:chorismate mutase-like protein